MYSSGQQIADPGQGQGALIQHPDYIVAGQVTLDACDRLCFHGVWLYPSKMFFSTSRWGLQAGGWIRISGLWTLMWRPHQNRPLNTQQLCPPRGFGGRGAFTGSCPAPAAPAGCGC